MANSILASLLINVMAKSDVSGLNKTTKSLKNMGQQASKTGGLLKAMSTKLFGGFNIDSAINMGMKYLQFEKDLGAMQSRFFAITGDQRKAREEFDYIRKVATDTAQDIKSTADSYSIFYAAAAKSMGGGVARQIFKDWTDVSRVLHLTPYQFERVTYALREMASKGAIYSQDLRMQIGTHVPNAMGLAQKAVEDLGITGTDWFEKFQKQAKGNQPLINEFIKNFSKYAKMQFATPEALKNALRQPDALAKMIPNIGYNFMVEFSRRGGNEAVIKVLEGIKDALLKIDYVKLANSLGRIAKGVGKIFEYLPQILSVLKDIAMSVAIMYIGKWLGGKGLRWKSAGTAIEHGKFGLWLKAGLGRILGISILKGGLKVLGRFGLKSILKTLLGFLGGPVVGFLMWLPEIFHLCKWIWGKIADKDNKKYMDYQNFAKGLGTSGSNILNTMKLLDEINRKNPNLSTEDLRKKASYYVGKQASQKFTFDDHGQVILNFNGNFLTLEDLQHMIERGAKAEVEKKQSWWDRFTNKPTTNLNVKVKSLEDLL